MVVVEDRCLPGMFPVDYRLSPTLTLPFRQSYTSLSRGICNHTLTHCGTEGNEGQTPLNAFVQLWCKLSMVPFSINHDYLHWDDTKSNCCWLRLLHNCVWLEGFQRQHFLQHKSRQMVKPSDLQNITSVFTRNVQYKQMYRHLKIPRWHFWQSDDCVRKSKFG